MLRIDEPILICGVGRSGTSLVHSILGSHSELACIPETAALRRLVRKRVFERVYRVAGYDGLRNLLGSDERLQFLGIDIDAVMETIENNRQAVSGIDVYESANVTVDGSGDAKGAVFSREALAIAMKRDFQIEAQRDAALRAFELNANAIYGVGELDDSYGVEMLFDATI